MMKSGHFESFAIVIAAFNVQYIDVSWDDVVSWKFDKTS